MEELIIWRNKIRTKLNLSRKEKQNENENNEKEQKDNKNIDINEEMDEAIKNYEKQRKKRLEKQKKKQEKIELSNKKNFIFQEDHPHDNVSNNYDSKSSLSEKKRIVKIKRKNK